MTEIVHRDKLSHPISVGDLVTVSRTGENEMHIGKVTKLSLNQVRVQNQNSTLTTSKYPTSLIVVTEQYKYNKEQYAEYFI